MDDSDRLSALRRTLAERLGSQRYELWFGQHTTVGFADGELQIGCSSQFELQWLRSRLHATLVAGCEQVWGDTVSITYKIAAGEKGSQRSAGGCEATPKSLADRHVDVSGQLAADSQFSAVAQVTKRSGADPGAPGIVQTPAAPVPAAAAPKRVGANRPGMRSTFANFVVGKGNELARRTAQSVVQQPGRYGPLLLFGPPGVGKTHLCYAMLQQLRQSSSRHQFVRLTAEQFTGEFLTALDRRSLPSFRQKYRSIDVLFVDDIQFFAGKRATLDELMHTIDTLHERGRQVVLTSDRSPGELQRISTELVSRISGGLAIPLESPDYSTRLGVVRQLAMRLKVSLDEEIIGLIATQVAGSARQLAGAINRLVATSMARESDITLDLARVTLAEFVQQNAPSVRLADIQRAVCEVFGVEPSSLKSGRKTRSVTEPRMLAMWLARKHTRAALGEIGEYFGRRSHSTVVSAQKKIERLVSEGAAISVADRPCHVDEAIRQVEAALRTA